MTIRHGTANHIRCMSQCGGCRCSIPALIIVRRLSMFIMMLLMLSMMISRHRRCRRICYHWINNIHHVRVRHHMICSVTMTHRMTATHIIIMWTFTLMMMVIHRLSGR